MSFSTDTSARVWQCCQRRLVLGARPLIMGILNVTPDSFSDGGCYDDVYAAVRAGIRMASQGADIIDIGGVSTRPGSQAPNVATELERVLPVLCELRRELPDVALSVDTYRSMVALAALGEGADIINDVFALRHDGTDAMARVAAQYGAGVVLMHSVGEPAVMQNAPVYDDVVAEVRGSLLESAAFALEAGIVRECIVLDPGVGFGKTTAHNLALISAGVRALRDAGYPVLMGLSRKRFLGEVCDLREAAERDGASMAANVISCLYGADIIRVHDVGGHVSAMKVVEAVKQTGGGCIELS